MRKVPKMHYCFHTFISTGSHGPENPAIILQGLYLFIYFYSILLLFIHLFILYKWTQPTLAWYQVNHGNTVTGAVSGNWSQSSYTNRQLQPDLKPHSCYRRNAKQVTMFVFSSALLIKFQTVVSVYIPGLSLDHQALSSVSRIRLLEREEESLSCYLKACDAALSYLQELDKVRPRRFLSVPILCVLELAQSTTPFCAHMCSWVGQTFVLKQHIWNRQVHQMISNKNKTVRNVPWNM